MMNSQSRMNIYLETEPIDRCLTYCLIDDIDECNRSIIMYFFIFDAKPETGGYYK